MIFLLQPPGSLDSIHHALNSSEEIQGNQFSLYLVGKVVNMTINGFSGFLFSSFVVSCPRAVTVGGDLGEPAVSLAPEEQPKLLSTDVSLCLKVGLCKASSLTSYRREHQCWPSACSWQLGPLLGIVVSIPLQLH